MAVANNAVIMLMAHELTAAEEYLTAAHQQLDYLLGCNTTSYCFVTGYGSHPSSHPHHRVSQYVGETVRGMLVGGPNADLDDPYAANVLQGLSPAACYADCDQSYSCNEVTIYWNSPLAYLLAGVNTQAG